MDRTGQCHCGSLRVITMGESDRVYLCPVRRASAAPVPLSISAQLFRKSRCARWGAEDLRTRCRQRLPDSIYFCPNCGTTLYREGDRNPAVCGVAVGAFDTTAFPPPTDSIWEESIYPWLGLPTEHHSQGRPPAT